MHRGLIAQSGMCGREGLAGQTGAQRVNSSVWNTPGQYLRRVRSNWSICRAPQTHCSLQSIQAPPHRRLPGTSMERNQVWPLRCPQTISRHSRPAAEWAVDQTLACPSPETLSWLPWLDAGTCGCQDKHQTMTVHAYITSILVIPRQ